MRSSAGPVIRILSSALGGAFLGLAFGLVAIAIAPKNGFGDLAAAAVTTVVLIPLGFVLGGTIGWWALRRSRGGTV